MIEKKLYKTLVRKYINEIDACEQFIYNKKSYFYKTLNFAGYLVSLETVIGQEYNL
ncbi:hypothetical protein [Clostridium estertheticum]|uniref:hypothetical protein n=1 Tax=Clostridium estertheticum TaxID=238834 RepID=UPI001CF21DF6|nr:hypothetical protein [Clostridium estertheticum]MCB2339956.1 hypothetical protein [Clostridium estertheticum]